LQLSRGCDKIIIDRLNCLYDGEINCLSRAINDNWKGVAMVSNLINAELEVAIYPDEITEPLNATFDNINTPPGSAMVTVKNKGISVGEKVVVELRIPRKNPVECFGLVMWYIEDKGKAETGIYIEEVSDRIQESIIQSIDA